MKRTMLVLLLVVVLVLGAVELSRAAPPAPCEFTSARKVIADVVAAWAPVKMTAGVGASSSSSRGAALHVPPIYQAAQQRRDTLAAARAYLKACP